MGAAPGTTHAWERLRGEKELGWWRASEWAQDEEERPQWGWGPLGATFLVPSPSGSEDRDSMEWGCSPPLPTCPRKGCKQGQEVAEPQSEERVCYFWG